jgi:putative endonuclease
MVSSGDEQASLGAARRAAEARGRAAEARVAALYEAGGFRILARRWRCAAGEIDLIAERAGLVCFVEVKRRGRHAAEALTAAQQGRIIAAAEAWAAAHPGHGARGLRFDVALVEDGAAPRLVADAFRTG